MKKITTIKFLGLLFVFSIPNLWAQEFQLRSETTFNPTHKNRFALTYGMNPSLTSAGDLSNMRLSYARRFNEERFPLWWDLSYAMASGKFSRFTTNHQSATQTTDPAIEEQDESLTIIGLGLGVETNYVQEFIPFIDGLYEYIAASLTYNSFKEDFSGQTFTGPGISAQYSALKRFNDYVSAGVNLNYNLSVVRRDAVNDQETNVNRSLTLGNFTVGFDLSFYL